MKSTRKIGQGALGLQKVNFEKKSMVNSKVNSQQQSQQSTVNYYDNVSKMT